MTGLAFIAGFIIYLVICIIVITLVVKWAKKRGRGPIKWGIGAAIVMYHLVFWDFIPTWVVYKYYCATKAGFWVYKTPEQWKAENPGIAETLTWRDMSPDYKAPGVSLGYQLNERIIWIVKRKTNSVLPVGTSEELIIDNTNDNTLIRQIRVWAGYDGGKGFIKFWAKWPTYRPYERQFDEYRIQFKKIGRKTK